MPIQTSGVPAAPAAAPVSSEPVGGAPAQTGGMMDAMACEDPPTDNAGEPELDAPLEIPGEVPDQTSTKEVPAEEPAADPAAAKDAAAPAATEPASTEPTRRLANGQFATVEQLEIGYKQSSKEGFRLRQLADEQAERIEAQEARIAELESMSSVEPEPPQYTDEQLEEMGTIKALRAMEARRDWERKKEQSKAEVQNRKAELKRKAQERTNFIRSKVDSMAKDTTNWPGLKDLEPVMGDLIDFCPEVTGHKRSPEIMYWAAIGYQKVQSDKAASAAAAASKDAARDKSRSDASRSGGPGPSSAEILPAGARGAQPGGNESDDEYNARMMREYDAETRGILPGT